MAQKKEAGTLPNKKCIGKQQWLSAEPIFVREKSKKSTEENGNKSELFARSPILVSPSPKPCQTEPILTTNTRNYRQTSG